MALYIPGSGSSFTPSSFQANTSTTAGGAGTPYVFTVETDPDGLYNNSTGIFTCPGNNQVWFFHWALYVGATGTDPNLHKNGTKTLQGISTVASFSVGGGSGLVSLNSGDTVEIRTGNNATATGGAALNYFHGFRVS